MWEQFKVVVLKKNHRQGECSEWTELLNRARIGELNDQDIKTLESRVVKKPPLKDNILHVFYKNDDVNDHNIRMLNSLKTELVENKAITLPKKYKPPINSGRIAKTQYMENLQLKVGARVKLIANISTLDKLVNGSLGKIVGFEFKNDKDAKGQLACVVVQLDDPKAGEIWREKYKGLSRKYGQQNGTPIMIVEQEYELKSKTGKSHAAKGKVIQFPIKLAWASTAHGVQVILLKHLNINVYDCFSMCKFILGCY